jgi:hypothetical protein
VDVIGTDIAVAAVRAAVESIVSSDFLRMSSPAEIVGNLNAGRME